MRGINLINGLIREARRALFYRNPPDHSGLRERIRAAPKEERSALIVDALCDMLSWKYCIPRSGLSRATVFADLAPWLKNPRGMNALFRPWIKEHLDFGNFWFSEFEGRNTVGELADYLVKEMDPPPPSADQRRDTYVSLVKWGMAAPYEGKERVRERTVLILAAGRSGTTLFRTMLSGHRKIFSPPELHLLQFDRMGERKINLKEHGRFWMRTGVAQALEQTGDMTLGDAWRLVAELEERDASIVEVYRLLHRLAGTQWLVDKSPSYVARPEWLGRAEKILVEPKYIFLSRHPYSVMESFVRMRLHRLDRSIGSSDNENPWLTAEHYWTIANRNAIEFGKTIPPERWHQVSYEELVVNTEKVQRGVCKFLEIDFQEATLDPYTDDRRLDGAGDRNLETHSRVHAGRIDAWRDNPPPVRVSETTRAVAEELGYEVPDGQ